jgi:Domain of unknown function (DUF4157)
MWADGNVSGRSGPGKGHLPVFALRIVQVPERAALIPGQRRPGQTARRAAGHERESSTSECAASPRSAPRDFSSVPLFAPGQAEVPWLPTPPLPGMLQPALAVGPMGDHHEHAADRIADQVMRSADAIPRQRGRHSSGRSDAGRPQPQALPAKGSDVLRAPGIVTSALERPGAPLGADLRSFFEERFDHDFSQVRVHADAVANAAARALGAAAFTTRHHIGFARDRFAPASPGGRRLLAHELAHVVQQSAAPDGHLVQRQPAGRAEQEFGEDPLDAVDDGGSSIRVKPGPVRTTLIRARLTDVDGYTYDDPRLPHSGRTQVDPGAWIQGLIEFFDLEPTMDPFGNVNAPGSKYLFRHASTQRFMTRAEVVDAIVAEGAAEGKTIDPGAVEGAVTARIGPERAPEPSTSRVSYYLSVSGIRTGHYDPSTGKSPKPDAPGVQTAIQVTWELHKENESGPELTWTAQVTTFEDPANVPGSTNKWQLQSVYTGVQAAWVFSFLKGSLQVGPIAQLLEGFQRGQQTGSTRFSLLPTSQAGLGGQILYAIPGTDQKLQIGGQLTGAYTAPRGADATIDYAGSAILQWKF